MLALAGTAIMSGIFFYIGLAGDRLRRSVRTRRLGAMLLAVPILASLAMLLTRKDANVLWCSGALLACSLLLFLGFVLPGDGTPPAPDAPARQPQLGLIAFSPAAGCPTGRRSG